jgi:predicted ATPase
MIDITTEIAGCQITEKIYAGSRTLVYKGIDLQNSASVVIKLMRNEYPSFGEIVQFKNQYTITKNLDLAGVVKPLKLETYQNRYVILMEDFGGISLKEYVQQYFQGVLPLNEFFPIAIKIASIIDSIHDSEIIHKDIKPENILINPKSQEIKVTDFGIASQLQKETQTLKSPSVLEGTLAYISPEQTGRMNRGIDYRSDFYSLGVTFYELLTGKLPFNSKDAMELVHCHIAKQPIPIDEINSDIPAVLTKIVSQLMAKNAEDRYQSLLGLRYDLEKCLNELKNNNFVENFSIGSRDASDNFIIPEKLYGREKEVETILRVFDRVARASENNYQTELILVAGISGIGKTAIVNEVHKPIVSHRGYFAKGKFDQFQRNIPLSAFVQVFRDLIGQLLSESDVEVAEWKDKILEAIGNEGQLIIEVIPELEFIIGKQPLVKDLSDNAAQNRFNLLFENFLKVFATEEHPLVIFIDDLQWADSASLQLIKLLINSQKQGCLLLIGAYRDSEVFPGHPFISMLEEIKKAEAKINTITLTPLNKNDINNLVADTFNYTGDLAQPLTELVYQKAKGNPFFTTQFLKFLHEEECIFFDYQVGSWLYNIEKIQELVFDEDVIKFMASQLQKLPKETQDILKLSACIGNKFDLTTLAIVSNKSQEEASANLWKALQEGLIVPINDDYKFYQNQTTNKKFRTELEINNTCTASYQFLHDRVQQAAYSLIPEEEKQVTHLKIGQLLLQNTLDSEIEEKIFSIISHLNQSLNIITDSAEREELAKLNKIASQRAKIATAYTASLEYAITGIKLLAKKHWFYQYDLSLLLYNLATETSYLSGSYEKVEDFAQQVLQHAQTNIDKVNVVVIQILTFVAQGELQKALSLALSTLKLLDVNISETPTEKDIEDAFAFTDSLIPKDDIESLRDLPPMTDAKALATMRISTCIGTAAYISNPRIHLLIVLSQVNQCIIHGNTALSASIYIMYGALLCGVSSNLDNGYKFADLALELSTKNNNKFIRTQVLVSAGACIYHWKKYLTETIPLMLLAAKYGFESGNFDYVAMSYIFQCIHLYLIGEELTELKEKIKSLAEILRQMKQEMHYSHHQVLHQLVINLTDSQQSCILTGEVFDEEESLLQYKAMKDGAGNFLVYFYKLQLCYLFANYNEALENSNFGRNYLPTSSSLATTPPFFLYDSLTRLAIYHTFTDVEKTEIIKHVKDNQEKMHFWAKHAPENCLHKWYIVEAEICRVLLQKNQAIEYYDCAINLAK